MTLPIFRALSLAAVVVSLSSGATAESLASSASVAGSASVGSVSDSVNRSSHSSSRNTPVAAGEYRILVAADIADRPDRLRLTLQSANEPARHLELDLPRETIARHALAPGAMIAVSHRDYGLAFARGDTREPFFLALADDWHGGLDPKPVSL